MKPGKQKSPYWQYRHYFYGRNPPSIGRAGFVQNRMRHDVGQGLWPYAHVNGCFRHFLQQGKCGQKPTSNDPKSLLVNDGNVIAELSLGWFGDWAFVRAIIGGGAVDYLIFSNGGF
jgi:hypothetical protein